MTHKLYYDILGMKVPWNAVKLLDACEAIHSSVNGISDRMDSREAVAYMRFLEARIKDWSPTCNEFDAAVKRLCELSIIEYTDKFLIQDLEDLKRHEIKDEQDRRDMEYKGMFRCCSTVCSRRKRCFRYMALHSYDPSASPACGDILNNYRQIDTTCEYFVTIPLGYELRKNAK